MLCINANRARGNSLVKFILLVLIVGGGYYGYMYYEKYKQKQEENKQTALKDMELIMTVVDKFAEDMGRYPKSMEDLSRGQYSEELPQPMKTPWNGDYFIRDGFIECFIDNLQAQPLTRKFQGDLKWNVAYVAEGLPTESQPRWKKYGGAKFSVKDDFLLIEDRSRSEYVSFWMLEPHWQPRSHKGYTIETELKTSPHNDSDISIRIMDGRYHSTVSFYPNYISFCRGDDNEKRRINFNTYQNFHTYRINVSNNDMKLFIDGAEREDVKGFHSRGTSKRMIGFGADVKGNGKATGFVKYLNFCLEGTFRP